MNRAHVQTLTLSTNPHLFSLAFSFMNMMHARPKRPPKGKQLPNSFGLTGLAPVAWHNLRLSLYIYISIRVLTVLNLRNRG
jgi:hypothetical protein